MAREVSTMLMFQGSAEEAMNFYVALFPGSQILDIERYGAGEAGAEGSVKKADFVVSGHRLSCIDSPVKHDFTFTPSTSFLVECADAAELDAAFEQLADGGEVLMPVGDYGFSRRFGWVKDRFGVSWQLDLR